MKEGQNFWTRPPLLGNAWKKTLIFNKGVFLLTKYTGSTQDTKDDRVFNNWKTICYLFCLVWDQCSPVKTLPEAQRTQGIESITWVNLSTRIVWNWFQWNFLNWLQIWPPDGATCIGCQFCHRMHHLHIDSKFDHQMAPIALVANLPTRWRHLH